MIFRNTLLMGLCFANVSLAASEELPANRLRLTFHGHVDGSELLEITQTHALWTNRHWRGSAVPVVINDVKWVPRKQPLLMNAGMARAAKNVPAAS